MSLGFVGEEEKALAPPTKFPPPAICLSWILELKSLCLLLPVHLTFACGFTGWKNKQRRGGGHWETQRVAGPWELIFVGWFWFGGYT